MYIIRLKKSTNLISVSKYQKKIQVNHVGRRGQQGIKGDKGDKGNQGDPATNLVTSVNGKQGIVVLNSSDVGADSAGSAAAALNSAKTYADDVGVSTRDLAEAYTNSVAEDTLQSAQDYTDDSITSINYPVDSVNGKTGTVVINKSDVGLSSVDNTSDANKPISSATQTALNAKLDADQKGQANGVATLDGGGKVPVSQLPSSIMEYKGLWNASTNTPSLVDGTGDTGDTYRVSVAGTINIGSGNISFEVGDYVIYDGSVWQKADTTDSVPSVFGRTGNIISQNGDYAASQITNTPSGNVSATTVQSAINELDSVKTSGPATSSDNAVARYDGTTGKIIENSRVWVDDSGVVKLASTTAPAYADGQLYYDSTTKALTFNNSDSNVSLQIGEEQRIPVYNGTASTIANGVPVYINGQSGGLPTVALAGATTTNLANVAGITTESIASGTSGYITVNGVVRNINTSAFAAGATLYLSATAGTLTTTLPAANNFLTTIGTVLVSNATNGSIQVNLSKASTFIPQAATVDLGTVLSAQGLRTSGNTYPITTSGAVTFTGSNRYGYNNSTSNTAIGTSSPRFIMANATTASFNVTLPATSTPGYMFTIKKIDVSSNTVTVVGTIDGSTNYVLSSQYKYVTLISTTTSGSWMVVGNN